MVRLTIVLKIFAIYACFLGSRLELIPAISLLPIELGTAAVIVEFTQDPLSASEDSQSASVCLRLVSGSATVPAAGLVVSLTVCPGPPGPGGASGVCV